MVSTIPLVSFLITLLLATALCKQGVQVTDTDGNPVQGSEQYFIQPVKTATNNGGGLLPASLSLNNLCPLGVTQTTLSHQPGVPTSITLRWPKPGQTIVETGDDVNIEFKSDIWPFCTEFTKFWGVNVSSSDPENLSVIIGTEPINIVSWFQIKTAGENIYKLATRSGPVGTIPGPWFGAPELVVTNDTSKSLFVKFEKVKEATLATY